MQVLLGWWMWFVSVPVANRARVSSTRRCAHTRSTFERDYRDTDSSPQSERTVHVISIVVNQLVSNAALDIPGVHVAKQRCSIRPVEPAA